MHVRTYSPFPPMQERGGGDCNADTMPVFGSNNCACLGRKVNAVKVAAPDINKSLILQENYQRGGSLVSLGDSLWYWNDQAAGISDFYYFLVGCINEQAGVQDGHKRA